MTRKTELKREEKVRLTITMEVMTLIDELYKIGIKDGNSILHFGAGYKNGEFILDLNKSLTESSTSVNYVGVEAENDKIKSTVDYLIKNDAPQKYQNIFNISMQDYIVDNNSTYDFTFITGIFHKQLYGDNQFQFIHSTINEIFNFTENAVVFTYNSSDHQEEMYNIHYMNSYVHNNYSRYSIIRINEHEYLYCINKYYLPYNNI
jgi:hypothetical protein